MEKDSYQFKVSTENGCIFITQEDPGSDDSRICLSPDQVDLLVNWLKEARNELSDAD